MEAVLTPATYKIVGSLKRAEGVDHYDRDTDFNPFKVFKQDQSSSGTSSGG
jgi:hypothetical protein